MKIAKSFNGLSGKELLSMAQDDCSAVNVCGVGTILIPMVLEFANQATISSKSDATHVSVQTSRMDSALLVKV